MSYDAVNHPSHYNRGSIECLDYIIDMNYGYCLSAAVKYIVRAGHKDPDKLVEDLQKAQFYVRKEFDRVLRINQNIDDLRIYTLDNRYSTISTGEFIEDQQLSSNRGAALISMELIRIDHPTNMIKHFTNIIASIEAEIETA